MSRTILGDLNSIVQFVRHIFSEYAFNLFFNLTSESSKLSLHVRFRSIHFNLLVLEKSLCLVVLIGDKFLLHSVMCWNYIRIFACVNCLRPILSLL